MPIVKIGEIEESCTSFDHNPPTHIYLEPGVYKHTCGGCGKESTLRIERVS